MNDREAFEKFLSDQGVAANYMGDGQYGFVTQLAWLAWQAATAAALPVDAEKRDARNFENFQKLVDALERIYKDSMACAADIAADTLVEIGYWERTGGSKRAVMQDGPTSSAAIAKKGAA